MAIKYLRNLYGVKETSSSRPKEFVFPLGLPASSTAEQANETFDVLIVAGGGGGAGGPASTCGNGGGGAGGVRLLSANSFTELSDYKNSNSTDGTVNFIPVVVGGGSSPFQAGNNSCFSSLINCGGGRGGSTAQPGGLGGSGGGGGGGPANTPPKAGGVGGCGICGQGLSGGNGGAGPPSPEGPPGPGAPGGCATPTGGLSTSFTGTPITYGVGGPGNIGGPGTTNRGNGGGGSAGAGGSGLVAIRYCNPSAPTTPIATGGSCICCTGSCIIHIFTSSGFMNLTSTFNVN